MESMTGFGNASENIGSYVVTALARSVNNKGLSLFFRLPREAVHLEQRLHETARSIFARGRIDVNVSLDTRDGGALPEPDRDLARAYIKGAEQLAGEFSVAVNTDAFRLVTLPGIMRIPDPSTGEGFEDLLVSCCEKAFQSLSESRRNEGHGLEEYFRSSLERIRELSSPVASQHSERVNALFQERRRRVEELSREITLDENRLAQELALLSDRIDISEEYQRLAAHIDAAMAILDQSDSGRKMGFILQEMHRELNTMGAKVDCSEAVYQVIEMKDLLGGLREQVANVQ